MRICLIIGWLSGRLLCEGSTWPTQSQLLLCKRDFYTGRLQNMAWKYSFFCTEKAVVSLISGGYIWCIEWVPEKGGWEHEGGQSIFQQGVCFCFDVTLCLDQVLVRIFLGGFRAPCRPPTLGGVPSLPGKISWIRWNWFHVLVACNKDFFAKLNLPAFMAE